MVGVEGFEPRNQGLGKLLPILTGFENFTLYYIPQQLTSSPIPVLVLDLTRFEQRPATVLLQSSWPLLLTLELLP